VGVGPLHSADLLVGISLQAFLVGLEELPWYPGLCVMSVSQSKAFDKDCSARLGLGGDG